MIRCGKIRIKYIFSTCKSLSTKTSLMNRRTDFVKYGQKWLAITSIYYLCSSEHRAYSLQRAHTERQLQRPDLFTQSVVNLIHSLCVFLACSVVRRFSMSLKYTVQLTCNVGERRSVDISVSEKKKIQSNHVFPGNTNGESVGRGG